MVWREYFLVFLGHDLLQLAFTAFSKDCCIEWWWLIDSIFFSVIAMTNNFAEDVCWYFENNFFIWVISVFPSSLWWTAPSDSTIVSGKWHEIIQKWIFTLAGRGKGVIFDEYLNVCKIFYLNAAYVVNFCCYEG